MSHITLIRHGQANSGATDEADYDRLSPLGHQQAQWLGQYMKDTRHVHTRLYTGTLRRHIETADGMATDLDAVRDERLNELEYFTLANALKTEQGIEIPTDQAGFVHHLPRVFAAWQADEIEGAPERFSDFEKRVSNVIEEIGAGSGPALVVTSGGLIAMVMRQQLNLDIAKMANIALAIKNSSMHRLYPVGGTVWTPAMFNAVPHLETPDRHHAQTHV